MRCPPHCPVPPRRRGTARMITDDVIAMFKSRFADYEVAKPSICNGLDKCDVYHVHTDSPVPTELREPAPEPEVP